MILAYTQWMYTTFTFVIELVKEYSMNIFITRGTMPIVRKLSLKHDVYHHLSDYCMQ